MSLALDGGFADPVLGVQSAFRAVMDALANPGRPQLLGSAPQHAIGIGAELAALALTLCDHDTPLWLDPGLVADPDVVGWLRFQTGVPLTQVAGDAAFAFANSASLLPPLAAFALGSDQYPDRSTTIALAVPGLVGGAPLTLRGPGIKDRIDIAPQGLPDDFVAQWADNRAIFPRGVDLLLVAGGQVLGLPRTTRISEG